MKLYLGCAEPPFHAQHLKIMGNPEEWTWVDLYVEHPKIKKWDATILNEVEDGSCGAIYASHLLEHIEHARVPEVLALWFRKLTKGGKLILNVPDLVWAAQQIIKYDRGEPLKGYYDRWAGPHGLLSILYGSQSHPGEYHKGGFVVPYLRRILFTVGFGTVNIKQEVDAHDMGVIIVEAFK